MVVLSKPTSNAFPPKISNISQYCNILVVSMLFFAILGIRLFATAHPFSVMYLLKVKTDIDFCKRCEKVHSGNNCFLTLVDVRNLWPNKVTSRLP